MSQRFGKMCINNPFKHWFNIFVEFYKLAAGNEIVIKHFHENRISSKAIKKFFLKLYFKSSEFFETLCKFTNKLTSISSFHIIQHYKRERHYFAKVDGFENSQTFQNGIKKKKSSHSNEIFTSLKIDSINIKIYRKNIKKKLTNDFPRLYKKEKKHLCLCSFHNILSILLMITQMTPPSICHRLGNFHSVHHFTEFTEILPNHEININGFVKSFNNAGDVPLPVGKDPEEPNPSKNYWSPNIKSLGERSIKNVSNDNSKSGQFLSNTIGNIFNLSNKNRDLQINFKSADEIRKEFDEDDLLQLVLNGLNLKSIPDMGRVNISQQEYSSMYNKYISRLKYKYIEDPTEPPPADLKLFSMNTYISDVYYLRKRRDIHQNKMYDDDKIKRKHKNNLKTNILLKFSKDQNAPKINSAHKIDEANIRLMLLHGSIKAVNTFRSPSKIQCSSNRLINGTRKQSPSKKTEGFKKKNTNILRLKIFRILENKKRKWIDYRNVIIPKHDESNSQWIQIDVSKEVTLWLNEKQTDLILEIQCDKCLKVGAKILTESSSQPTYSEHESDLNLMPVLNIVTRYENGFQGTGTSRIVLNNKISNNDTGNDSEKIVNENDCISSMQRCCRHFMHVIFKDLKGFEFIIQPKKFDAGYCRGKCPPRFNPANHHAVLQSLIWKQDHQKAPRPCCAPSKLKEIEVLHVDDKDNAKLKISTWSDMIVLECACS